VRKYSKEPWLSELVDETRVPSIREHSPRGAIVILNSRFYGPVMKLRPHDASDGPVELVLSQSQQPVAHCLGCLLTQVPNHCNSPYLPRRKERLQALRRQTCQFRGSPVFPVFEGGL